MKTYYSTDYKGMYPVPHCAIIVAPNRLIARRMLSDQLKQAGIKDVGEFTIIEIKRVHEHVELFQSGDY